MESQFTSDDVQEEATEFSSGSQEVFSSEASVEEFGDSQDQVVLSGLPLLADSIPDGGTDVIPQVQLLALGDSISTGYGLADPSQCFVNLLAQETGLEPYILANDGLTSDLLVASLVATGQYDAFLADVDVVTLTIGGNDMMAVFYQMVVDAYNTATGDSLVALDVPVILADVTDARNEAMTTAALTIMMSGYDQVKPAFETTLASVGDNIKNIASYIKHVNPDATIIIANQYNPYKWLEGLYAAVGVFFNGAVQDLNAEIASAENGAGTLYSVVDVYSAFALSEDNLCNATSLPLNLDFHPNAAGHAVIASLFAEYVPAEEEPEPAPVVPVFQDATVSGNTVVANLAEGLEGFDGYDFVIGAADCIETKDYIRISKNQKDLAGEFYYVPEGTYYVYCHAWTKDENNIKQFSDWSEGYQVKVTAVTPETPEITNVVVKGNAAKITYTKCEDAIGYDLVFGKEYKKVNDEYRPTNYGTYVKKIKNADTVTVVCKNIEKGTYYVGLHAYNRTSEDQKKVFSPWSKAWKVTIK